MANDKCKFFYKCAYKDKDAICNEKCSAFIPADIEGEDRQGSESVKNDELDQKLRWDLLPLDMMEWLVKVYTFGARKYKPNSWQLLGNMSDGTNPYQRYKAALLRHMVAHEKGEFLDPESGLPHLAHCAWNGIAMLYFGLKERENNNK